MIFLIQLANGIFFILGLLYLLGKKGIEVDTSENYLIRDDEKYKYPVYLMAFIFNVVFCSLCIALSSGILQQSSLLFKSLFCQTFLFSLMIWGFCTINALDKFGERILKILEK